MFTSPLKTCIAALLGLTLLAGATGCGGDSPLNLDAAKALLPNALQAGEELQSKFSAIDTVEKATAAKAGLAPMITKFADMFGKLNAVKGLLTGDLASSWSKIGTIKDALAGMAGKMLGDSSEKGTGIVNALGKGLLQKLTGLGN